MPLSENPPMKIFCVRHWLDVMVSLLIFGFYATKPSYVSWSCNPKLKTTYFFIATVTVIVMCRMLGK